MMPVPSIPPPATVEPPPPPLQEIRRKQYKSTKTRLFGNWAFISTILLQIGFFKEKYTEPGPIAANTFNCGSNIPIAPSQPSIRTFQQGLSPFGEKLTKFGQNFIGQVVV
jgi:hypothetical protein